MKKYSIRYRKANIKLPINPRTGTCTICGRKGLTNCHHFKYEYTVQQVREKPELAIKNIIEACYTCHKLCNMFKYILEFETTEEHKKITQKIYELSKKSIKQEE